MTATLEITTGDVPVADLGGARIMLGDVELGRFEGQDTVRFEIPVGRHVLVLKDGFGMSAAMRFVARSGHVVSFRVAQHEPEVWGLVFGGFHVLQRTGTDRVEG